MTPDVTIVGGGLAGCSLAWACLALGARVRLYDRGDESSASRVAAGLITPLTGHRLAVSWRLAELFPAALDLYRAVESQSGMTLFDANTTLRLFTTTAEAAFVAARSGPFAPHLVDEPIPAWADAPHGAVGMNPAGRLRVPEFLAATRARLGDDYRVAEIDLATPPPGGWVAFCHGLAANPHFPGLRFRPTKGEVLTLSIPEAGGETRTLNCGGSWLTPRGDDTFLAGSTYDHDDLTPTPTAQGRESILNRLAGFARAPIEVVGQRAGVRPILDASRPALGSVPGKRFAYFNGLGSKGALTAPYFARMLAGHMLNGTPIEAAVGLGRLSLGEPGA